MFLTRESVGIQVLSPPLGGAEPSERKPLCLRATAIDSYFGVRVPARNPSARSQKKGPSTKKGTKGLREKVAIFAQYFSIESGFYHT